MFNIQKIIISVIAYTIFHMSAHATNTSAIQNDGKQVTMTLPLTATITADAINRSEITVTSLSSLYDYATWDTAAKKFKDQHILFRAHSDKARTLLVEIINDQYTCGYYNHTQTDTTPAIAEVNKGYGYSLSWVTGSGGNEPLDNNRRKAVNAPTAWLNDIDGSGGKFMDLSLDVVYPTLTGYTDLMKNGGLCRGSITILVTEQLP